MRMRMPRRRMRWRSNVLAAVWAISSLAVWAGCDEPPGRSAAKPGPKAELSEKSQREIGGIVFARCGSLSAMKLLDPSRTTSARMARGAKVYFSQCLRCHGEDGDGQGPAAPYLDPKPRDFRKGLFKFTSTEYGQKPLRDDLIQTVRRGAVGSSMPSFDMLAKEDVEAVVDYVLALSNRGELEARLIYEIEQGGELDNAVVQQAIDSIVTSWREAESKVVSPLVRRPPLDLAAAERGRKEFVEQGCVKCHGEDGRGNVSGNKGLTDAWGNPTRAADLTSGMLRGGQTPLDIYRKILGGINGTPMPAFSEQLKNRPDVGWELTAYVMSLTNVRRLGEVPLAAPFPQPTTSSSTSTATR